MKYSEIHIRNYIIYIYAHTHIYIYMYIWLNHVNSVYTVHLQITKKHLKSRYASNIWMFPKIVVPPNHPFLIGFSIVNHPFWGTPIFGNTHIQHDKAPIWSEFRVALRCSLPAWNGFIWHNGRMRICYW